MPLDCLACSVVLSEIRILTLLGTEHCAQFQQVNIFNVTSSSGAKSQFFS